MSENKIAIGGVVRNRAWILPDYLHALEQIDYPNKSYLFLENDSTDETYSILTSWAEGKDCRVENLITETEGWARGDYSVNQYENLANVRNKFVEMFLKTDAQFILSVDSDIIVQPNIIQRLIQVSDENTIVGAAISNIPGVPLNGSSPGNFMVKKEGMIIHPPVYNLSGMMDVDVIGAVYLIPRKVLEDGVSYGPHPQGEDIPFCERAKDKGYRLKVLLDLVCDHRMIEVVKEVKNDGKTNDGTIS
jgi:GT2 family glycosyltransferase